MKDLEDKSIDEIEKKIKIAELKSLSKPFYKRDSFYSAMLPIFLGTIGLIATWLTGVFDSVHLEMQEHKVELQKSINKLKKDSAELQAKYIKKESELEAVFMEYTDFRDKLSGKIEDSEAEIGSKNEELTRKRQELAQNQLRESDLGNKLNESYERQNELIEELKSYERKLNIVDSDNIALEKANSNYKKANFELNKKVKWTNVKTTKPKFKEKVLLYRPEQTGWYSVRVGYLSSNGAFYMLNEKAAIRVTGVTHWKPIFQP